MPDAISVSNETEKSDAQRQYGEEVRHRRQDAVTMERTARLAMAGRTSDCKTRHVADCVPDENSTGAEESLCCDQEAHEALNRKAIFPSVS